MKLTQILLGFHSVISRLRQAPESVKIIYIDKSRQDKRMLSLIDQIKSVGCKLYFVNSKRLNTLSYGKQHQGVIMICDRIKLSKKIDNLLDMIKKPLLLLILDRITDPHNLGACLRTANASGVHAVIAPKDGSANLDSIAQHVSCGTAEVTPYIMVTNLARTMRQLKDRGIWLVGTDDEASEYIYQIDARQSIAWIIGSEGSGMRHLIRKNCDQLAVIPMLGTVKNLNVSNASAICLYESVRQRLYLT